MIIATRIPMLTEQMRAATLRAISEQRAGRAGWTVLRNESRLERHLVDCLHELGYEVTLARAS